MNLTKQLQLAQVKRWPICHMNREQSVAEHSYNVMLIAKELVGDLNDCDGEQLYLQVLAYALVHDMDEVETGDIPSPFKRRLRAECPAVVAVLDGEPKVDRLVQEVVKAADYLEAIYWLREFGGSRTAQNEIMGDICLNMQKFLNDCILPYQIKEKATWLYNSL